MKNIIRFLIGIGVFILALILGAIVFLLLSPLIVVGSVVFIVMTALTLLIVAVVGIFAFIWYMARKEPVVKHSNYSMSQGRDSKSNLSKR